VSAILEINVRAKPKDIPIPDAPTGSIQMEIGKKYVTKSGAIIQCTAKKIHPSFELLYYCTVIKHAGHTYGGYYYPTGLWQSCEHQPDYKAHIVREWISELHDAWLEGATIEFKWSESSKNWSTAFSEPQLKKMGKAMYESYVAAMFGQESTIVKRIKQ
jgi:hypothetical protein